MDKHTDFYGFYNRVLQPEIIRVEPLRQRTLTKLSVITITTLLATAIWVALVLRFLGGDLIAGLLLIIPLGVGGMIAASVSKKYRDEYQLKLIAAIVRAYNKSFRYDRNDAVREVAFTDCGLFQHYMNYDERHYRGTNRISGKIGDTAFELSDLNVSGSTDRDSPLGIFHGVFLVADLNKKKFSGKTFVTSRRPLLHNAALNLGRWLGQPVKFVLSGVSATPPGEVVKLEDAEFESAFVTRSDSQIEARYILSPSLMRRILQFSRQRKTPIAISFSGTSMFIAMYDASTKLEPVLWQTLQKPSLFFSIWANLDFLCGIVDQMDLNRSVHPIALWMANHDLCAQRRASRTRNVSPRLGGQSVSS